MRLKLIVFTVVILIASVVLIFMGTNDFVRSRKLVAEGKPADATVVSHGISNLAKNQKVYNLVVTFSTLDNQTPTNDFMVSEAVYDRAVAGGVVRVFYLPSDPSISMVGDRMEVQYNRLIGGSVVLVMGVLLAFALFKFPSLGEIRRPTDADMAQFARTDANQAAQKIVSHLNLLCESQHEYAPVDARQYRHLDLGFYDEKKRFLEGHGFVYLGDVENVNQRKSSGNPPTFLRMMLGGNGTVMSAIYHFSPRWMMRLAWAKESKVIDFETQFSNGCFVCTSNAESAGKLTRPPEIDSLFVINATPIAALWDAHQKRVEQFAVKTSAQPVQIHGLDGMLRAQAEMQRIKSEYRKRIGMTRSELQNMGGGRTGERESDLLFEEILKEHGKERRKKD